MSFPTALQSETLSLLWETLRKDASLTQSAFTDAKSFFEDALKREPDSAEAMHWLAVAEHRTGEDIDARLRVDQILKSHPLLPCPRSPMKWNSRPDQADFRMRSLQQLNRMAIMPEPPASEYCRLGAIWMKMSNLAEAEPALLRGTMKDPYSYACHLELGELYRETGQLPFARQLFEFVVHVSIPILIPPYSGRSRAVYVALGDPRSAAAILRKGLRLFPADPELQRAVLRR